MFVVSMYLVSSTPVLKSCMFEHAFACWYN